MKKINLFLVFFTLICAFFTIMTELDKGIVVILKDSSIIFTLTLPYILRKFFKLDISDTFTFIWIIFIFLAHYLGVTAELYFKIPGFDKVTHTMSGVLSACAAYLLLKNKKINDTFFNILFIISFSFMCAGMWEIFEFTCNALVGGDAQRVAETGVDDTMWDIIVAFFGSTMFIIYVLLKGKLKSK